MGSLFIAAAVVFVTIGTVLNVFAHEADWFETLAAFGWVAFWASFLTWIVVKV